MSDGDGVTPGEVYRRLLDHKQDSDRTHAALDAKLTDLAKDTVPLRLFQQSEGERVRELQRLESEHDEGMAMLRREHAEDIRQVRGEIKELRERPNAAFSRWTTLLSVVTAILTVAVMAWGTLRGAK